MKLNENKWELESYLSFQVVFSGGQVNCNATKWSHDVSVTLFQDWSVNCGDCRKNLSIHKLRNLFHRRFGHHLFDVIEPLWTTIGIWILGISTIPTILQIMNLLRTQNHLLQSFNPFFILKHFKVNIALWYNINAMHSFITMRENVNTFDNFNSPSSCSLLEDVEWFIRNWSERNPSVSLKSDSLRSN